MYLFLSFWLFIATALGNTEKTIFLAPAPITLPTSGPSLAALGLETLTPTASSLRTSLNVTFDPQGSESWYLLNNLNQDQRYELRVCWAATQPTRFHIDTFNITHVWDTPELIQSLALFTETHLAASPTSDFIYKQQSTVLFLRITSTADFFATNETLMLAPPPVDVDLILDPYLGNVFPASLVPTAIYILMVAICAWLLSGAAWKAISAGTKQHLE